MESRMKERLSKIRSAGYWRINLRPTEYNSNRIGSLSECRDLVESSQVRLRGWYYPHIDEKEFVNGQNWVASGSDFGGSIEYWRLYQSGQFIHQFAMEEDYGLKESRRHELTEEFRTEAKGYLSILSTLYSITEIFEFTARMASKGIFVPGIELSIRLIDTEDRQLFFWDKLRTLNRAYKCTIPEILYGATFDRLKIMACAPELALDATRYIFERFNWSQVPMGILAEEQRKLLERRL